VLGFRCGSVPEVVDEGITGAVVDNVDEAIATLPRVLALDRGEVRRRFEERFTASRMARDYLAVYRSLLKRAGTKPTQEEEDMPLAPELAADTLRAHIDS
jgi:glycosyltransferase involved in cell wall biosynthesis